MNALKDLNGNNGPPPLRVLDLSDNDIEKIEGIEHLVNLKTLKLSNNRIKKIEGLEKLTQLEVLWLDGNRIEMLEGLQNLKNLKELRIGKNIIPGEIFRDLGGMTDRDYVGIGEVWAHCPQKFVQWCQDFEEKRKAWNHHELVDRIRQGLFPTFVDQYHPDLEGVYPEIVEKTKEVDNETKWALEYVAKHRFNAEVEGENWKRVVYNGRTLPEAECQALNDLQNLIGKPLPELQDVLNGGVGYVVEDFRVVALGLTRVGLKRLPDSIGNLKRVREMWLNGNELHTLPESIGELRQLKRFVASHNNIEKLPYTVAKLINLEALHVQDNQMSEFPQMLIKCPKLALINLSKNNISKIPETIQSMRSLNLLSIRESPIQRIPAALVKLPNFEYFSVDQEVINRSEHNKQVIDALKSQGCDV